MAVLQERTATVDGLRARWLEGGSGPTLVLLHGGTWGECAEASWEAVAPALAGSFHVIAPDWLGFGGAELVRDFALAEGRMLTHLAALLTHLEVADATVVGLSMGAALLLRDLTSPAPSLPVARAVLVSGGGPPMKAEIREQLGRYDGSVEGMRAIVALSHHQDRFAADADYVGRRHAWSLAPGAYEAFAAMAVRRPPTAYPAGAVPGPPPAPDLSTVAVPVLVCAGAHDRFRDPGWAEQLAAGLPTANVVTFAESGHVPPAEEPDAFVQAVTDFALEDRRTT